MNGAKKEKKVLHLGIIKKLAMVMVLVSFATAFVQTIWAIYLDSFLHSEVLVGFLSALLTIIAFISYFLFIPIIEKKDISKIFPFSLFLLIISYFLFSINENFIFMVILAIIVTLSHSLRLTSIGLLVKNKSPKKSLSKNEGFIYTLRNISWVMGPLIAGYILSRLGMRIIFVFSAVILIIGLILFNYFKIKDKTKKTRKKIDGDILKNFFDFFKNKKRLIAYFLGGGVNLWWSLIYLFIPLEIIRSGLNKSWIGYFLFAIAIPLIIFEYPFSKWAGKNGFAKLFKIGYLIVCLFSLVCFFISNIYIILGLLVLASFGMAMLEPTTETYFLDILKEKNEYRFYGPYNTAMDAGLFIGKVSVATLLIFLPFKFVYLLFAGFMFLFFLLSFKVKDIVECKFKTKKIIGDYNK